jgi:hypothetical protein
MPAQPLSEADLFATIWQRLIRRSESTDVGGPPRRPTDAPPDVNALPSLPSDGLLIARALYCGSRGDRLTV